MEETQLYKFHYFYKITNLVNNKYYYGVHSTNNLNDGYMGSGKRILYAIKKYGIENFKKEILKYFNSRIEMFEYEHLIINEEILKDPLCYNLMLGGYGGINDGNEKGYVNVSDDNGLTWKSIIKEEYHKNKKMYITKNTNKVSVSDDNGLTWKFIPKEEYYKNKNKYITLMTNRMLAKDKFGKIYIVYKNDERLKTGELVHNWFNCHHTKEVKEKIRKTMTPKDSKNPRVWVSKDGKFKYLRKELLEEYLNNGWEKGRIKKEKEKELRILGHWCNGNIALSKRVDQSSIL